ncbi:MAG: hypothetical protein AB7W59_32370 [Acidimicrobiia bacterium]
MAGRVAKRHGVARVVSLVLGVGALVTGGIAMVVGLFVLVLLIGPLVFWLAWNQLGLAESVGLPELGFWATVLAALFLGAGWFGKVVITAAVFVVDPTWLSASATVRWPEPTLRNLLAIALLAMLAARPHARHDGGSDRRDRRREPTAAR